MKEKEFSKQILVSNVFGLHARPAAQLAQEAGKFRSQIKLVMDENEVDAKSVLDILSLAATRGRTLTLRAIGPDADLAIVHLEKFLKEEIREN